MHFVLSCILCVIIWTQVELCDFVFFFQQAVNKLAEVMNRKITTNTKGNKSSSSDLKKKEKECRKLEQQLNQERAKHSQLASKQMRDYSDLQMVGHPLLSPPTPLDLSFSA